MNDEYQRGGLIKLFLSLKFISWLVLLSITARAEWQTIPSGRWKPANVPTGNSQGFHRLLPEVTGVGFTNVLSDEVAGQNQIRLNGSGVALGDVDGDGRVDIYLCRLEGPNALYRNLGQWKFEEVTEPAGVACNYQFSTGATFADVDGDGDLDLLVNSIGGGTRLFLNNGTGKFTEDTNSGLIRRFGAMSMALADIDGDGDLDLYVANYRVSTIRSTGLALLNSAGVRSIRPEDREQLEMTPEGRILERGEPDILYLNNGHGKFAAQSWTEGRFLDEEGLVLSVAPYDWGLSVAFRDINQDGFPDLYVCNDFHTPDRLWLNDGKGNFRAIARTALRNTSTFSMGIDFADINRDRWDDFIVLDMLSSSHRRRMMQNNGKEPQESSWGLSTNRPQFDRNVLQLNRGDGTYAETAYYAGVWATGWAWAPVFLDVDLDGFEDLLVTTGNQFDTQDMDAEARIVAQGPWPKERLAKKLLQFPPLASRNVAFKNLGDGRFSDTSAAWNWNTDGVSQGVALADLDNDGDLDVVVNRLNDAVGLFRNEATAGRISVTLKGVGNNTQGIGARIRLVAGDFVQEQEMMAGGRYLSSDASMRVFATRSPPMNIEVRWPNGRWTEVISVSSNRVYELNENASVVQTQKPREPQSAKPEPPIFVDASDRLRYRHVTPYFNELERQPLLSRHLAREGPSVSWVDFDGDGWDDLLLGGTLGGDLTIYSNKKGSEFKLLPMPAGELGLRDLGTLLGGGTRGQKSQIWASASSYRDHSAQGPRLVGGNADATMTMRIQQVDPSSTSTLAMTDMDGDGVLELFAGGRVIPGRYPEPASSHLYHRVGQQWVVSEPHEVIFKEIGLVTSAVWTDLNADGWPDLVLACEWGPLKVLMNQQGRLKDQTEAWGLTNHTGLWMAVAAADFDGDGRMDLVVGNTGLNTEYQASAEHPLRLYYGNLGGDGRLLTVESEWDEERGLEVPRRDLNALAAAWPELRERYTSHQAFGEASMKDLLAPVSGIARVVEAKTLLSLVLLNRGDHFEAKPLPTEAQLAPAFGLTTGDFDGDGFSDIFVAQNFFAGHSQASRSDAGRGQWFRGNGQGQFTAVHGATSGIKIYGEQRSAAASDYDHDGRLDLAVTQHAGATTLWHNLGAKPGLRVRLSGSGDNPHGIGAWVRPWFSATPGPAQEIRAGSGFLSADSPILILGGGDHIRAVEVRWPSGGNRRKYEIPTQSRSVVLHPNGTVETGD